MRYWLFALFLLASFYSGAQIDYSNLNCRKDSLYAYHGRLYTGNAVWKYSYDAYTMQIWFGLKHGKIVYHKILYSYAGQQLVNASYDKVNGAGESKKFSYDGTLASHSVYTNEYANRRYFMCPEGGLHYRDTILADGTHIKQEFFRNGVLKNNDSILNKIECRKKYDSLGNLTFSKTSKSVILDRLFGRNILGGFEWGRAGRLLLNNGYEPQDTVYNMDVAFNPDGSLSEIHGGERNCFFVRFEYYKTFTNRMKDFVLTDNAFYSIKQWDKKGRQTQNVVLDRQTYDSLSYKQQYDLIKEK